MENAHTVKARLPMWITATLSTTGPNLGRKVDPIYVLNGQTCSLLVEYVTVASISPIGFRGLPRAAPSSIPAKTIQIFILSFNSMQDWDWPVSTELRSVAKQRRFYWD